MFIAIARLIRLVALAVAAVIVAAIVLRLLSANPANSIVKDLHDAGQTLAGPFKNLFSIKNPKTAMAVNWGIAAVVYVIVGGFLASLIARVQPRRVRSVGTAT
jgi:archaellum component FlaG (FlaF/FlaG flagellin family)